ncbi:MAG: RES family NAD+ phosphorylase [Geminicoccaceae bacterium]
MSLPRQAALRQTDTHRLIPSKYDRGGDSVLARVTDETDLAAIFDLDHATNDRLLAENGLLPGITLAELVFGVPNYRIVNAAFVHAHPLGSRFNGPDRGAWYAGFEVETSQAEVVWHKTVALAEVSCWEDSVTYDDYLADFANDFHDIRGDPTFESCLDPASYVASQELAQRLLDQGSLGLVYPSVRHVGGTCLACFRPALVGYVRKAARFRFTWTGEPTPTVTLEENFL